LGKRVSLAALAFRQHPYNLSSSIWVAGKATK